MALSHKVIFTPSGIEAQAPEGATVLDVAREVGIDLDSVCGGDARSMRSLPDRAPSFGNFAKWSPTPLSKDLNDLTDTELQYQGRRPLEIDGRLGCQARIRGPVVLDVPPGSQLHAPVIRKEINLTDMKLDPVTTLHVVHLDPNLPLGTERLSSVIDSLNTEWRIVPDEVKEGCDVLLDQLTSLITERRSPFQLRRSPPVPHFSTFAWVPHSTIWESQ